MSALPPKADMCGALTRVRFVPIANIGIKTTREWQRIKLQILGNSESNPLYFEVVDDEFIAICRDLT